MGNVLVVDDDRAVCGIMAEALRDAGFTAECLSADQDAYDRITRSPPLVALVLDVNLGVGTTGFDIARFARQVIPDVAVVYVSGEVASSSVKAFGVPGSAFLEKPITPSELVEAVTAVFAGCIG